MIKIDIVIGTRPELIRLSQIIKKIKQIPCFKTRIIWTNQNYEPTLSEIFFKEFDIQPDIILQCDTNGLSFISQCMSFFKYDIDTADYLMILGDTNSCLTAALVYKKYGVPIVHLEAGNRCFDENNVPEEINRKLIDSISDYHLCYTQNAKQNLLIENKPINKITVIGNPITEVYKNIVGYDVIESTGMNIATIHRKENLTIERLILIFKNLQNLPNKTKLIIHPTLRAVLKKGGYTPEAIQKYYTNIEFIEPVNFKEFINLELSSNCVITDSGTVPEECYLRNIPCVLIRNSTERPELIDSGSMILCSNLNNLKDAIETAKEFCSSRAILEYEDMQVSTNVIKFLFSLPKRVDE